MSKLTVKDYMSWSYPGHARGYVFELFAHIYNLPEVDKVKNLRAFALVNETKRSTLKALFDCVLHPKVVFDLPPGVPGFQRGNNDPDRSPASLFKVRSKLYYFLTNSPDKVANDIKRHKIFIGILESLPVGDALTLCAIKDLDYDFIGLSPSTITAAFPDWYKGVQIKTCPLDLRSGPDTSVPQSLEVKRGRGRPKGSKNKKDKESV